MSQFFRGYFITGTDTGVGKTVFTAALVVAFRRAGILAGVMKPVETGVSDPGDDRSDAARLKAVAGVPDPLDHIRPYCFQDPIAPLAAARRRGTRIDLDRILAAYRTLTAGHPVMLVEGVGGLRVPLTESQDLCDLMSLMGLPVILVARPDLGGVNHALLTIEALERRGLPLEAVVFNQARRSEGSPADQLQQATTVELIQERTGTATHGILPFDPDLERDWTRGVDTLAGSRPIQKLLACLLQNSGSGSAPLTGHPSR